MGAPLGNTNGAKRHRLLTDALKRQLTQNPDKVEAIAKQLIDDATSSVPEIRQPARTLLFERVDGKVPQAIIGDDDEPALKFSRVIRSIVDPANNADAQPTDR
jgi:hypothetical protein